MIKPGIKVRFNPYHALKTHGFAAVSGEITGTVVYNNPQHRYFTAEYEVAGEKFRISFNYIDLTGPDKVVYIVKE